MATFDELTAKAAAINTTIRGIITRDPTDEKLIQFIWNADGDSCWFSTGYFPTEQEAIDFSYLALPENEDELMNILKNDKLFPHIRGVMLKDKPVVLTLSGKVNITELQGGDARVELFFTDHAKTAVVNRNQALNIIEMYGPETDDWKGHKIQLYAEHGAWFGKEQWGVRVSNQVPQNGKSKTASNNYEVKPFEKAVDEPPADPVQDDLFGAEPDTTYQD